MTRPKNKKTKAAPANAAPDETGSDDAAPTQPTSTNPASRRGTAKKSAPTKFLPKASTQDARSKNPASGAEDEYDDSAEQTQQSRVEDDAAILSQLFYDMQETSHDKFRDHDKSIRKHGDSIREHGSRIRELDNNLATQAEQFVNRNEWQKLLRDLDDGFGGQATQPADIDEMREAIQHLIKGFDKQAAQRRSMNGLEGRIKDTIKEFEAKLITQSAPPDDTAQGATAGHQCSWGLHLTPCAGNGRDIRTLLGLPGSQPQSKRPQEGQDEPASQMTVKQGHLVSKTPDEQPAASQTVSSANNTSQQQQADSQQVAPAKKHAPAMRTENADGSLRLLRIPGPYSTGPDLTPRVIVPAEIPRGYHGGYIFGYESPVPPTAGRNIAGTWEYLSEDARDLANHNIGGQGLLKPDTDSPTGQQVYDLRQAQGGDACSGDTTGIDLVWVPFFWTPQAGMAALQQVANQQAAQPPTDQHPQAQQQLSQQQQTQQLSSTQPNQQSAHNTADPYELADVADSDGADEFENASNDNEPATAPDVHPPPHDYGQEEDEMFKAEPEGLSDGSSGQKRKSRGWKYLTKHDVQPPVDESKFKSIEQNARENPNASRQMRARSVAPSATTGAASGRQGSLAFPQHGGKAAGKRGDSLKPVTAAGKKKGSTTSAKFPNLSNHVYEDQSVLTNSDSPSRSPKRSIHDSDEEDAAKSAAPRKKARGEKDTAPVATTRKLEHSGKRVSILQLVPAKRASEAGSALQETAAAETEKENSADEAKEDVDVSWAEDTVEGDDEEHSEHHHTARDTESSTAPCGKTALDSASDRGNLSVYGMWYNQEGKSDSDQSSVEFDVEENRYRKKRG